MLISHELLMTEKYTICSRQSHVHSFSCDIKPVWWKVEETYYHTLVRMVSYSHLLITYKSGVVITLPAAAGGGTRIFFCSNIVYTWFILIRSFSTNWVNVVLNNICLDTKPIPLVTKCHLSTTLGAISLKWTKAKVCYSPLLQT